MEEITRLRAERDQAFAEFVAQSSKATRSTLKANAARKRYTLINDELRALERDVLSYPVEVRLAR